MSTRIQFAGTEIETDDTNTDPESEPGFVVYRQAASIPRVLWQELLETIRGVAVGFQLIALFFRHPRSGARVDGWRVRAR